MLMQTKLAADSHLADTEYKTTTTTTTTVALGRYTS